MLTILNPRLGRSNVVLNSFHSCVSHTSKKLPWTPEMSFSKVLPQPRMFFQKFKGAISFKQLKSPTNAHSRREFNKQMDVVNSDMEFIDFTAMLNSHFMNKSLTVHPDSIKLQGIFSIFTFPDKMESILPERVFPTFQFHFLSPQTLARNKVHTKFVNLDLKEGKVNPLYVEELNINKEDGNSSLCLKAEVSLPWM